MNKLDKYKLIIFILVSALFISLVIYTINYMISYSVELKALKNSSEYANYEEYTRRIKTAFASMIAYFIFGCLLYFVYAIKTTMFFIKNKKPTISTEDQNNT